MVWRMNTHPAQGCWWVTRASYWPCGNRHDRLTVSVMSAVCPGLVEPMLAVARRLPEYAGWA